MEKYIQDPLAQVHLRMVCTSTADLAISDLRPSEMCVLVSHPVNKTYLFSISARSFARNDTLERHWRTLFDWCRRAREEEPDESNVRMPPVSSHVLRETCGHVECGARGCLPRARLNYTADLQSLSDSGLSHNNPTRFFFASIFLDNTPTITKSLCHNHACVYVVCARQAEARSIDHTSLPHPRGPSARYQEDRE